MFTQIPESLAGLDLAALTELHATVRGELREALASEDAEKRKAALAVRDDFNRLAAEIDERKAAQALADTLGDDEDEDDDDSGDDDEAADKADHADDTPKSELSVKTPAPKIEKLEARPENPFTFRLTDRAGTDFETGAIVGDLTRLAEAIQAKAGGISLDTNEKHTLAVADVFNTVARLSGNPDDDMAIWDAVRGMPGASPELVAACCGPATPVWKFCNTNTLRRPFLNSLPGLETRRGIVEVWPGVALSDIAETAVGVWTCEDDVANPLVPKGPCATIECGEPEKFTIYGVYACLTVQNLTQITAPELVAAYINRLLALQARLAEIQMMNAAGAASNVLNSGNLGYGSATTIATQIIEYLAFARERERLDDEPYLGWAHRWVRDAIRIDLSRRRRDGSWHIATEAEVNRVFADAGVEMTWVIDQAAWMTNVLPTLPSGPSGNLPKLPSGAQILLAPRGKFAAVTKGTQSFGLAGSNPLRDVQSVLLNQHTIFTETFETLVDTTDCPSSILNLQGLCHNGQQIADVPLACNGSADLES